MSPDFGECIFLFFWYFLNLPVVRPLFVETTGGEYALWPESSQSKEWGKALSALKKYEQAIEKFELSSEGCDDEDDFRGDS